MLAIQMLPKYAGYVGGIYDAQGGSYLMLILLNMVLVASILGRREQNTCDNLTICALILAICFQCLGYSMGIFGRVVCYFSIYIIFAVPNVMHVLGKKIGYGWRECAFLMAMVMLVALAYMDFSGNKYVVPYYTSIGGI